MPQTPPKVRHIIRAEWPELDLCFDNGETKRFSIMPYTQLPGYRAFQTSACASLFSKAHIQAGTVVWNDELDMSPDNLYLDSANISRISA